MANYRILSFLALSASLFALGVIELGAFTRLMDAGLGCPDWPGCYGHLTVPLTSIAKESAALQFPASPLVGYKAWAEMIHRYFVGGLSLFILSVIGFTFWKKNLRSRGNIILSVVLILLLAYQILLGRWTVTLKLLPIVVTQHLLGGFFILGTLWLIFLMNRTPRLQPAHRALFPPAETKWLFFLAILGLLILLGQISLGAWTSTNYASLSCSDFPFCHANETFQWQLKEAFNVFAPVGVNYEGGVLSEAARQTIQMMHRIGALIFTVYMFFFMVLTYFAFPRFAPVLKTFYFIFGLIVIQICIGITNVVFKLPLATAILHNLLAALLLISLITLLYKIVVTTHEKLTV